MKKSESKYYSTAVRMDQSLLQLLNQKDLAYITVKEICALSQVNRSTFYLHYETVNDLLLETTVYIGNKFASYFEQVTVNPAFILTAPKEDLIFITPEFLNPWLSFIRENKVLYRAVLRRFDTLPIGNAMYDGVYQAINSVLRRFSIPEEDRPYMIRFYLEGLNAIVKQWLQEDCGRSIEEMIHVIEECVRAR